jgi:hypothetical protein
MNDDRNQGFRQTYKARQIFEYTGSREELHCSPRNLAFFSKICVECCDKGMAAEAATEKPTEVVPTAE